MPPCGCACCMTGQMSGLSDLGHPPVGRGRGAARIAGGGAAAPADEAAAAAAAAAEARMAELRGAAAALKVAISGARADVV